MATINVTTARISKLESTEYGQEIISTYISGNNYISEDISNQTPIGYKFITSYSFFSNSLEVFLNGLKLSSNGDFLEEEDLKSFSLQAIDTDLDNLLSSNPIILIKYIRDLSI